MLSIDKLTYRSPLGIDKLTGLTLHVRAGEIYGIAGVEGNGQSELLSLLWGTFDRSGKTGGSITIDAQETLGKNPSEIAALGVSMIPEDRHKSAIIAEYGIEENLILGRHREKHSIAASDLIVTPFTKCYGHDRAIRHPVCGGNQSAHRLSLAVTSRRSWWRVKWNAPN